MYCGVENDSEVKRIIYFFGFLFTSFLAHPGNLRDEKGWRKLDISIISQFVVINVQKITENSIIST